MTLAAQRTTAKKVNDASKDTGRSLQSLKLAPTEQFSELTGGASGRRLSPTEIHFYERSLAVLVQDLVDTGLDQVEILFDVKAPMTNTRIDVVLCGVHPTTGADSYVLIELKQWTNVQVSEDDPDLVVIPNIPGRLLHPLQQVRSYCRYLVDHLEILSDRPEAIHGVAYLYSASDENVCGLSEMAPNEYSALFTKSQRGAFHSYLRMQFSPAAGSAAADRLLASPARPGKHLMAVARDEIRDRRQYTLLDNQRVAYNLVFDAVSAATRSSHKEVVVVTGGPGSGKSVIGLSLLGELTREGLTAMHATGSQAFTQTLRRIPGKGSSEVKSLFRYFNSFAQAAPNEIDVLICDEAHRIRQSSSNRFTPTANRSNRTQIEELIAAARVPVFLLDESQIIRPGEIGTTAAIRAHAAELGLRVRSIDLDGQFRLGGSTKYEQWVQNLLSMTPNAKPERWTGDPNFDLKIARSPWAMEEELRALVASGETARITAGFCWPWSEPREDGALADDIVIGDWSRPWAVKGNRSVRGAPSHALWSTDPNGFGQVGTVYATQGFEFDWAGVILGPDILARDDRLVTVRRANRDPAFRSRNSIDDNRFDVMVRKTYKILLTRSIKGIILHSVDPRTQNFLEDLVGSSPTNR
ncbi:DUF2075 domain-containing protein [Nocardia rhamnosiphila]|uniref:DUF2075 domain-containing protein n=1 Tax=Nocardia rhamnosiphila TaxID=426716 RepID=A0ABV2WXM8_9NOCA